MCQAFSRECVGANGWAGSALAAWHAIPASHRHGGTPRAGSIVYFDNGHNTGFGHAVFCVGANACYSTDIVRHGKVDLVPLSLIHSRWGMRQLGWIDWTPSGAISLKPSAVAHPATRPTVDLSLLQLAARQDPPAAQGHRTPGAAGSVVLVERALSHEGLLTAKYVDGSYGTLTKTAYAGWQRKLGYTGKDADGIPGATSLGRLGTKYGFRVIA
jgi:hypothetical protein